MNWEQDRRALSRPSNPHGRRRRNVPEKQNVMRNNSEKERFWHTGGIFGLFPRRELFFLKYGFAKFKKPFGSCLRPKGF
jgi:hypothetical protein